MEPFETFDHAGVRVELHYDTDAGNPFRDFDQAAELRVHGSTANAEFYGGEPIDLDRFVSTAHAARYLTLVERCLVAIPYRLEDHGSNGSSAYLTDTDDTHVSGFVVVTPAGIELTGAPDPERAAREDFETFRQWVEGEVFGYVVDPDGEDEESLWGMYGRDYCEQEAREAAEEIARERAVNVEPPDVAEVLAGAR